MTERAAAMSDEELERALARHPRIGERAEAPRRHDAGHSTREQSGVDGRPTPTSSAELADGNLAYEERFGRVFIIKATSAPRGDPRPAPWSASTTTTTPSAPRPSPS